MTDLQTQTTNLFPNLKLIGEPLDNGSYFISRFYIKVSGGRELYSVFAQMLIDKLNKGVGTAHISAYLMPDGTVNVEYNRNVEIVLTTKQLREIFQP